MINPITVYHMITATTLLAHSQSHSGHSSGAGWWEQLIRAIIRGFGWRVGASAAEALIHLLGVTALFIVGAAVVLYLLRTRRARR